MVKAKIKTNYGTEIEIESDSETIKEIVLFLKRHEKREEILKNNIRHIRNEIAHNKQPTNLTETILKLKLENFFEDKRTISDIRNELARRGFHYPSTTLSAVLLNLLKKGVLGRLKENKQWRYVKRWNQLK